MNEVEERILQLILSRIGFERPGTVTVHPPNHRGHRIYRDVEVTGHPPLVCTEHVAGIVSAWLTRHTGTIVEFCGHRLRIGRIRDLPGGLAAEVENLWSASLPEMDSAKMEITPADYAEAVASFAQALRVAIAAGTIPREEAQAELDRMTSAYWLPRVML